MNETGARILLVDDDRVGRLVLARALENEGHDVVQAEGAVHGVKALRSSHQAFDLVLLDVLMPVMDGIDLLRYLKAEPDLAALPVIMVSAHDDLASVVRCLELGADDYITKPYDPVLLRARIGASLAKKRLRDIEQAYARSVEEEEARSERLLLQILPQPIASRLKAGEAVIADSFSSVTVLFADLVGFTTLAAAMEPGAVVEMLNEVFSAFDRLAHAHSMEKIKTIGDAYLVAGGLLDETHEHVVAGAHMALAMQRAIERLSLGELTLRIGLHTGPVVAGVIGVHKFSYDLWGDTVNIASRMESQGEPGRIHVTPAVREILGDEFLFEPRGVIDLRGRGPLSTYFLVGARDQEIAILDSSPEIPSATRGLDL